MFFIGIMEIKNTISLNNIVSFESHLKKFKIEKGNERKGEICSCSLSHSLAEQRSTLGSVFENHTLRIELWGFLVDIIKDTEMKVRMIGTQALMKPFKFYFGCQLGERLLVRII